MENQSTKDLHNQDDVNPSSQLDKLIIEDDSDNMPKVDGTGGNRPVQTESTVIIKDESYDEVEENSADSDDDN